MSTIWREPCEAMSWRVVALDEALLGNIRSGLKNVKIPSYGDRVRKTECVFSFDTPESPEGLFVSLTDFQGFGADCVGFNSERTNAKLYVNIKWKKIPKPAPPPEDAAAPTKLAIGVEGGFQVDDEQFDYEKTHFLAVYPDKVLVPLPNPELPELIGMSIDAILKASDLSADEAQVMAWEEKRQVSKYADSLVQLDNGIKISPDPSKWVCAESGLKENLWLNLSDGYIGSGRQQVDAKGQMSGGTGAALKHYQEEKLKGNNFCLCVKLGTITPGGADVYSYAEDEDDMVEDPHLAKHLSHWGINMMTMEKTEKTMAELQIDLNISFDFDKICESGKQLVTVSGPGFVGLKNLGNSCYMNSTVQVLFSLPELKERYLDAAQDIFRSAPLGSAPEDFRTQAAKLAVGLLTDKYCTQGGEDSSSYVSPQMFKFLVGKGHPEFSTGKQQDAFEYWQHLFSLMERSDRAAGVPALTRHFEFETEDRLVDMQVYSRPLCTLASVSVINAELYALQLHNTCVLILDLTPSTFVFLPSNTIADEHSRAAVNAAEVVSYEERRAKRQKSGTGPDEEKEEPVKRKIPFELCLQSMCADSVIDDYLSPVTNAKGQAVKNIRFKTFPKYLVVHLQRYILSEDWTPKKLDCLVPAPQSLDLSEFEGKGQQPGEELLPESSSNAPAASAGPIPDAAIVQSLLDMGFAENGAKRAALATNNSGPEAAMEWVFAHMEDADFNDPIPPPSGGGAGAGPAAIDDSSVEMLMAMGFAKNHATKALRETGGNLERAGDWLMSHMDQLDAMEVDEPAPVQAVAQQAAPTVNYQPKYNLIGIISHIGTSTACGHYVCHIKKDGKWTIFNDRKVALSEEPPFDLGYMYLYESVGPKSG